MARININDDFWQMVQNIAGETGNLDKVTAQALRLIQFSQIRYKEGKIITRKEYDAIGFLPQFIGVHMEEIEPGCLQYVHAKTEFEWLIKKKTAGKKGGKRIAEIKAANKISTSREINALAPSTAQTLSDTRNPLPLSLSLGSKEPLFRNQNFNEMASHFI